MKVLKLNVEMQPIFRWNNALYLAQKEIAAKQRSLKADCDSCFRKVIKFTYICTFANCISVQLK